MTTDKKQIRKRVVPAVDRAARLMAIIEAEARPMSITELANSLDVSKGTVREILETLREHGLLDRDEHTKRYRLGPQLVRLGASSRGGQDVVAIARPYLETLSDVQREMVLLLAPFHDRLVIQEVFEPANPRTPILVSATPGRAFSTTAGIYRKVIMSWSDEKTRARLQQAVKDPYPGFEAELAETRQRGYAIDDQEFMQGVRGVAAPVLDQDGRLVAVILLSGVVASMSLERLDEVGAAMRATVQSITRSLSGNRRHPVEDQVPVPALS